MCRSPIVRRRIPVAAIDGDRPTTTTLTESEPLSNRTGHHDEVDASLTSTGQLPTGAAIDAARLHEVPDGGALVVISLPGYRPSAAVEP